jgi:hypothetical protein
MIKPSTKRADLLPVYSFNSPGISLAKSGALVSVLAVQSGQILEPGLDKE